nr:MAG TPA: hypothetical protein [Caudoviricetes sp.]
MSPFSLTHNSHSLIICSLNFAIFSIVFNNIL